MESQRAWCTWSKANIHGRNSPIDSTYNLKLEDIISKKEHNPFPSSILTKIEIVGFKAHWMHAIQQNLMYTHPPCYVQMHWSANDIKLMQLLGEHTWFCDIVTWEQQIISRRYDSSVWQSNSPSTVLKPVIKTAEHHHFDMKSTKHQHKFLLATSSWLKPLNLLSPSV